MNEQLQLDLEVQCACGKTATRLCDGIVALVRDPNHDAFPVMVRLRENPIVTCDRPLCDECVAKSHPIFDLHGPGQHDASDFCSICVAEKRDVVRSSGSLLVLREKAKILHAENLQRHEFRPVVVHA
jgi:hypothetical protein